MRGVYASSDPFGNELAPDLLEGVWIGGEEDPDSFPEATAESSSMMASSTEVVASQRTPLILATTADGYAL